MSQPPKLSQKEQATIDEQGRALFGKGSEKINDNVNAQLAQSLDDKVKQIEAESDAAVNPKMAKVDAEVEAKNNADMTRWQESRLAVADKANSLSAATSEAMDMLSARTEYYSADNIIDRVFADDIARGEAMYDERDFGVKSCNVHGIAANPSLLYKPRRSLARC